MGFYSDLMGFYGDQMGYSWDLPSGNLLAVENRHLQWILHDFTIKRSVFP